MPSSVALMSTLRNYIQSLSIVTERRTNDG
nr:MAG TPA: hypothetical protein [Caudoviricetes sp.]